MTNEEAIKIINCYDIGFYDLSGEKIPADKLVNAFDMAIKALNTVKEHEETFELCIDCKEYDKENYCCHRWSKVIRNTVKEIEDEFKVVRCEDCEYGQYDCTHMYCDYFCHKVYATDYCSNAVKRREP